jgi:hypothetical protein
MTSAPQKSALEEVGHAVTGRGQQRGQHHCSNIFKKVLKINIQEYLKSSEGGFQALDGWHCCWMLFMSSSRSEFVHNALVTQECCLADPCRMLKAPKLLIISPFSEHSHKKD